MDTVSILESLSYSDSCQTRFFAEEFACSFLSRFTSVKRDVSGNILAAFPGTSDDRLLLLDAHIDQIGFVVTSVDATGFLHVASSGGVDLSVVSGQEVIVWGKQKLHGVIAIQPPHLAEDDKKVPDIQELVIDIGFSAADAEKLTSPGDFVSFAVSGKHLLNGRFTAPALDNRAGVAALLSVAETLPEKQLPFPVALLLSNGEELGCRGALTGAFGTRPDSCICVDVSFGDFPEIAKEKCGKLGNGPMIGFSPILDLPMTHTLQTLAQKDGVCFQTEVMGGECGTNADVISGSRTGIKTAMLSIPLRNMHTPAEVIQISDVESTARLIESYTENRRQMPDA